MKTITNYMAGHSARQYFPYRLNFSVDAPYLARQVLTHVLVQLTHRQLIIQKCRSCRQVSVTSYTKLHIPMRHLALPVLNPKLYFSTNFHFRTRYPDRSSPIRNRPKLKQFILNLKSNRIWMVPGVIRVHLQWRSVIAALMLVSVPNVARLVTP